MLIERLINMARKSRIIYISSILLFVAITSSWVIYDYNSKGIVGVEIDEVTFKELAEIYADDTDDSRKEKMIMRLIFQSLSTVHYQPLEVNDEFSEKVYKLYLERIDYNKSLITEKDLKRLNVHKIKIDEQIKGAEFDFFDLSLEIILAKELKMKEYYEEILAKPFDYTIEEKFETDFDKREYVKDDKELKDRWRKLLKYQVLVRVADKIEVQEKAEENKDTVVIKTFDELEKETREAVLKTYRNLSDRFDKQDKEDRLSVYINSITNIYGPHTNYFPPIDKDNFDIAMSGRLEGIGARLMEKDGYITVTEIVPGSASALQGELEAEDLIMEVAQEDEDPVNVVGAKIDDAVKIIRGPKGTTVTLTVKKLDGNIKKIPIVRDVVIIEETYAKSAVLNYGGEKFGIIDLPKFYADFNNSGGRSSFGDVRNEVEKLKKENIQGLVLDLRSNGGGSLYDAVNMAGLFIENGPVVQVKQSLKQPEMLKDNDPTVQYDGQLIILVDYHSASASEILAAAIQDYGRGVVVGSKHSFGKGTVQRFFDLDNVIPNEYADLKPLGAVKVTTSKFYRINGGATQLKGVIPDIILPNSYSMIDIGEKEQDHVMAWDKITPATYDQWETKPNIENLKGKSGERTNSSETFSLIKSNAERFKRLRDETVYSLHLETYQQVDKAEDDEAAKYKDFYKEIEGLEIAVPVEDQESVASDEKRKSRIETWHKGLQKDPYIEEVMLILGDMK